MKQTILEPAKTIPVLAEADVVVAGGGPSGVMAAVAAARHGARTILVERFSCLGGVATMGLPIQGYCAENGEQIVMGLPEEFRQRLTAKGGAVDHFVPCKMHNPFLVVSPEAVKNVCQEMLLEAGVTVLLDTVAVDVAGTPDHLEAILVEGKSGRQAILGRFFIDATGDADLVARAGLPYTLAAPEELQASTLGVILSGVDKHAIQKHLLEDPAYYDLYPMLPREQIAHADYYIMAGLSNVARRAAQEGRFKELYGMVNFVTLPEPDMMYVNTVHVSGRSPCDTAELSALELAARTQTETVLAFLREYVPGFRDAVVVSTGPWLGIRESRIIDGLERLTIEDIRAGHISDKAIALGGYPYDFHQQDVGDNKVQFHKVPIYGIPYGCLVPKGAGNMLVAGKTISATREAMCSSRVMAQCMAEGQAAGTAAAMCAASGCAAPALDVALLRQTLLRDGATL